MDHNLEDTLTMETIEMDFDHTGVVVNQEDITLEDSSQSSGIPMDLDTIEEQPNLLDTGNEEVIITDFMGDQFGFQEYTIQGDNLSGANITVETNQLGEMSGPEQVINLPYADCVSKATTTQSNYITIKSVPQQRVLKKTITPANTFPRQVAIAPKPTKGAPNVQYAIAPKPVALVMNKNASMSKTVPVKNVVQGLKGNVLAQIGKQLVMMPAGAAGQKIKLTGILPSGSTDGSNIQFLRCGADSAQLVANKGVKPLRTKLIVQGQTSSSDINQPAVITKIVPVSTASQARYVMQQKTVPISIGGNKVVITTPPKQSLVKVAPKKQIISIKAQPSPKVVTSQANVQTKKVVITANPTSSQNIVVKASAFKASSQLGKDSTSQVQRTQLHPINVPGKGIQFIKLVTNQPAGQKTPTSKPQTIAMSGKNFVLTDSKGNIIQMSGDKVMTSQQSQLLVTSNTTANAKLPTTKKLVRIAPISKKGDIPSAKVREATKMAYCVQPKPTRAPQSLLMPRETPQPSAGTSVSIDTYNEMVEMVGDLVEDSRIDTRTVAADVKPTLASLISDAVAGEDNIPDAAMQEIEIEYENTPRKQERFDEEENSSSMEHETNHDRTDESLLIVPQNVDGNARRPGEHMFQDDSSIGMDDTREMQTVVNIEADVMPYLSPRMDYSDSMFQYDAKNEPPGLRPRKACNCTKSQCLKLYCDCFANGEFCNKCNCNNCHNNLENEELRQKAIRACLERNPNAFRPKIGKTKTGGPEIIRRHNKGCNCKRSGCLKNYCECYEAKIACTLMCKCVGCRNIEETLERRRDALRMRDKLADPAYRAPLPLGQMKQPCSFMTPEVIEAVAQCMLATACERARADVADSADTADLVEDILMEFSRCMADIIDASHHPL